MSAHLKVHVVQGKNPKRFHMLFSEAFGSDHEWIGGYHYPVISEHMRSWISNLRVAYDIRVQQRHISFIRHRHVALEETISTIIDEVAGFMPPRTIQVYMPR